MVARNGDAPVSSTCRSEGASTVTLTLTAGSAVPVISSVVNAASFAAGVAPGSLATLFGVNLGGAAVLLNGVDVQPFYASDTQVNFYVPAGTPLGANVITVTAPSGLKVSATINLVSAQPGIFSGAVVHAGTLVSALTTPVSAGDYIADLLHGTGTHEGLRRAGPHHGHAHGVPGRHGGEPLLQWTGAGLRGTLPGGRADSSRTSFRDGAAGDYERQRLQ